ncbi:MAG TPA: hypothetical protein VFV87_16290 [Pirellulaceae bacterium]|nr:hypothetical protein [Pirellulaceae bacterium]
MKPIRLLFAAAWLAATGLALARPVAAEEGAAEGFTPSDEFQGWISDLVREQLPQQYEKRKNWGHTTRTLDGISIQLDNGKLKTHRKYKQANDGTWQMYRVDLVDPEEKFEIRVANLRELEDGRVGLRITAVASLQAFGRQTLWEHGIQIYSLSAEADARVRLTAEAAIASRLDPTRFPPDVYLLPEVTAAKVEILEFKLRRISDLHGPLVRSLSHTVREELEAKLAEDNAKLVAKLNAAIDKRKEKLKLSAADLVTTKWGKFIAPASSPSEPESRAAGE